MSEQLSVAKDIKALALINIQDIFRFTITATDKEIEDRYGSEARAIEVAEKYLEIAMRTSVLEYDLKGWSVTYSVPIKDKNERIEKTAYFYDIADRKTEPTISKMEQVDEPYIDIETGILHWCGWKYKRIYEDEPQTDDIGDCNICKYVGLEHRCNQCVNGSMFCKVEDEPQTCDHRCVQTEIGCERADCMWK